jgi:Tol biopolymer transport system component
MESPEMNTRTGLLIALVGALGLLMAACAPSKPAPTPTAVLTGTSAPTSTPTATATPSATPTQTLTPPPTPTPKPALAQLTTGGCCVQPSWSPDSRQVLFIDRPAPSEAASLYAVDIPAGALQPPQRAGPAALYSRDRSLITYPDRGRTVVEKVSTGEKWIIPNNGQSIAFSPDNQHLAWEDAEDNSYIPYDQRRSDLFIAGITGTNAIRIARLYGGGFSGWLPNGQRILVSGRKSLDTHDRTLSVYDLNTKTFTDLLTVERMSATSISNNGTWIAYTITFDTDKSRNGLWIQRTDGTAARKVELWGAYQWRDDGRLLVIPARTSPDRAFEVMEVEAATGKSRKLTDALATPLNILNGDWRVSPEGRSIVYVNSADRNLWLLTLPPAAQ